MDTTVTKKVDTICLCAFFSCAASLINQRMFSSLKRTLRKGKYNNNKNDEIISTTNYYIEAAGFNGNIDNDSINRL
jgi:hypothetical protein